MKLREEIKELDYITEQIVRYERENDYEMGEAFENYDEALDWLYTVMEGETDFRKVHTEHEKFFELLMRTGLHRADLEEDIWKLEARLEEYSTQGYDQELVARYRLEAEELDNTPLPRDSRASSHITTEISYRNSFEEWSTAKWRAGFQVHEKLSRDLMLEKLNNHIHNVNQESEIDEHHVPTGPEIDDAEDAPTERALRNHEEIGSYENALQELGFLHLNEANQDSGRWHSAQKEYEEGEKAFE